MATRSPRIALLLRGGIYAYQEEIIVGAHQECTARGIHLYVLSGGNVTGFVVATLSGLVRNSDQAMRNALIAATMPTDRLMATMGVSRTTGDSARIAGSLAGGFGLLPLLTATGAWKLSVLILAALAAIETGIGRQHLRRRLRRLRLRRRLPGPLRSGAERRFLQPFERRIET